MRPVAAASRDGTLRETSAMCSSSIPLRHPCTARPSCSAASARVENTACLPRPTCIAEAPQRSLSLPGGPPSSDSFVVIGSLRYAPIGAA